MKKNMLCFSLSLIASACGLAETKVTELKRTEDISFREPWGPSREGALYYKDCKSLQDSVASQIKHQLWWEKERMNDTSWTDKTATQADSAEESSSTGSPEEASEPSLDGITNLQEKGVEEPDHIKVTDHLIAVLTPSHLQLISRSTFTPLAKMAISSIFNLEFGDLPLGSSPLLYGYGNRLVLVAQVGQTMPSRAARGVQVVIFDVSNKDLVIEVGRHQFQGELVDSRMTEGHLFVVLRDELPVDEPRKISSQPVRITGDDIGDLPCERIGRSNANDANFGLTKIASIAVSEESKKPQIAGVLGGGEDIYMTKNSLFVVKKVFRHAYSPSERALLVTRFELGAGGSVELKSDGLVLGDIDNSFHFKELAKGQGLAVATTTEAPLGEDMGEGATVVGEGRNHLFVLQEEGNQLATVKSFLNFGKPNEDIRAVRYVGHMAYVVTFEKTDPLYSFDFKEPFAPQLVGELEIPGFSMYLHPNGPDQLIGLGYAADDQGDFSLYQGLQVSLFDVSDPRHMQQLAVKVHGERGSYSEATTNHHAFYHDPSSETFAVPMVELTGKGSQKGGESARELAFSGAVFYKIQGQELVERGRVSHSDWIPSSCSELMKTPAWWSAESRSYDVNRIFKLDQQLVSASPYGLKVHGQNFETIQALRFDSGGGECI